MGTPATIAVELGSWEIAEDVSEWIELAAIIVIGIGVILASISAVRAALNTNIDDGLRTFRHQIAKGLLVGLDLLIAADIIRTVTLEPTIENVGVLALIVFVRTVLSWTLVIEHEHRWPWQSRTPPESLGTPDDDPVV